MPGYSPVLPLTLDPKDGILLNKTYASVGKQNLKMLILTVPGERVMDPEFGVGAATFLFDNDNPSYLKKINATIRTQVSKYLPYITIVDIRGSSDAAATGDPNSYSLQIEYIIQSLNISDIVKINFDLMPNLL
jgi:hypothetical protein